MKTDIQFVIQLHNKQVIGDNDGHDIQMWGSCWWDEIKCSPSEI